MLFNSAPMPPRDLFLVYMDILCSLFVKKMNSKNYNQMKNVVNRALGAKKKRFFQRNVFLKFLMVLLAIGWSTSAVKAAPSYFRVEIIPVLENGAVGKLFACDNSSANSKYNSYLYNIGKDGLWTVCSEESTHWEQTIERGQGLGTRLLHSIVAEAKRQGTQLLRLHAQTQAVPFYEKCGFQTVGDVFTEADIPHILMEMPLS